MTTFLHLTDFHVSDPALADGDLMADTGARLGEMLAMIAAMEKKPAFAVVSGDLTNHGDVASYRYLRTRLAGIGLPLLYALGNHDTRPGFYRGMLDRTHDLEAPYCHEAVIEGVHVVVLDSSVPGRIGGALGDGNFVFLEHALTGHPGLAKIIVVHHAPALDGASQLPWETLGEDESARLAAAIRGRNVAGILAGHVHVDRVAVWNGVPVVTGTGLHNGFDPLYSGGLRAVAGAGFALCTLRPSGLAVTFVPLPSDRRELAVLPEEKVRAFR
ncbi:MAG TPA: phosphodiesterase [Rhizobiales bacterium]|nr:phosphodiesterase [Hyphomicrobiales bacterium]